MTTHGDRLGRFREQRYASRYTISIDAKIYAAPLGSGASREFTTLDVSETGLLMRSTSGKATGFNASTLFEIWLYPADINGHKVDPIFMFARFVRYADDETIGVRISDMEDAHRARYVEFIKRYAKDLIPFAPENPDVT